MTLSGTWLYLGNFRVLGGTGNSPFPDTMAERNGLAGQVYTYDTGMQFLETSWTTQWYDTTGDGGYFHTAFPKHSMLHSESHRLTYDIGAGEVTSEFMSFLHYEVELTFQRPDLSTYTTPETFTVRQTANGDVFLTPSYNHGPTHIIFPLPLLSVRMIRTTAPDWNTRLVDVRDFTPGGEPAPPIVCFTRGTLIMTDRGERAIEDLKTGDLVLTKDRGLQPIRWIGSRRLDARTLDAAPKLRPIRIRAGALGESRPAIDLIVSPQHRILVRSRIARKMFGADEVLVAAKQLLQVNGIEQVENGAEVEYFHMLFEQHEVVFSNGAESESLYTGPMALRSVGEAALAEIHALFPELKDHDYTPQSARPLPSGHQARKLAERHARNGKPLFAAS